MDKLRLRFEKTGRAVYISHLDLMRMMQRAFLRADLPIKYSEGFNPHAVMSICLPLSVGCASLCELLEFRMDGECDLSVVPARLTAVLPEGIRVTDVYAAERRITELKWLRVRGVFEYDHRDTEKAAAQIEALFARDSIVVTRKTKRGEGDFELKDCVSDVRAEAGDGIVTVEAVISAQEPTVNPELLAAALRRNAPDAAPDFALFTRLETFDGSMNAFR